MRLIFFLAVIALVCGCISNMNEQKLQYVCPQGQVVANASECQAPTTSTTSTTESTTTTTTSTTSSSTSTTATTIAQPMATTTTLCDQSWNGYLLVNDVEDRCYKGYGFKLDDTQWNCTTSGGCRIDFIVTRPNGASVTLTAAQSVYTGITFHIDELSANVFCTHQEMREDGGTDFVGVIKFSS
jgi:hypothetical protein